MRNLTPREYDLISSMLRMFEMGCRHLRKAECSRISQVGGGLGTVCVVDDAIDFMFDLFQGLG